MNVLQICLKRNILLKRNLLFVCFHRPLSASGDSGDGKATSSKSSVPNEIEVGRSCTVRRAFSAADVEQFAQLTGDYNPLHFDDRFAKSYRQPLAPFSPVPGSILLQQDLHFPNPLYVGEEFVTKVTIANKRRNIYFCQYECTTTADGKKVVEGMAKILLQQQKQDNMD
ncbi:hydroxyacyl-thioester dehydratase htd2 [Tyrophagus putrescentiae]|nr:hydroxyacyl-thioester dehydratase htd2 [Tyrophagus putrescentiae]